MSDLIFIAVLVGFFVLCALYVQLCDHLIGPDDPALAGAATDSASDDGVDLLVPARAGTGNGGTA